MKPWSSLILLTAALLGVACANDDDTDALKAPTLTEVAPMEGGLHVMWKNTQTNCDKVEAERKMVGHGDYAAAFSVPGSVDNEMDAAATENMMYTYRLRCQKGESYSPYSNELSANPHDL